MVKVTNLGVVLKPSQQHFESQAVLNPACLLEGDTVHMFYRAVAPGNYSSIGYAKFKGLELISRSSEPVLKIEHAYEQHGLEDPRLVFCEGIYYLFYVVYDGSDTQVAFATATDLTQFTKQGMISSRLTYQEIATICAEAGSSPDSYLCKYALGSRSAQPAHLLWEKDSFIFPGKFNDKFAMLCRFLPGIQVFFFNNFAELTKEYWVRQMHALDRNTILVPQFLFENLFIGGGCPPIKTEAGWLLIYHAVTNEGGRHIYRAAAALLDLDDPTKVIGRLPYPLFSPEQSWELSGDVPNVVFPTGAVVQDSQLYIYYGAADSCIACCKIGLNDLVEELLNHPVLA